MVIYLKLKIDINQFRENFNYLLYKYSSFTLNELKNINMNLQTIQRRLASVTLSLN